MPDKTNKKENAVTQRDRKTPVISERIENTNFDIHIHFSETSKETFTDKVVRLIRNDPDLKMGTE